MASLFGRGFNPLHLHLQTLATQLPTETRLTKRSKDWLASLFYVPFIPNLELNRRRRNLEHKKRTPRVRWGGPEGYGTSDPRGTLKIPISISPYLGVQKNGQTQHFLAANLSNTNVMFELLANKKSKIHRNEPCPLRCVPDSNGCKRFCRPVTKPLIHRTIFAFASAKVALFVLTAKVSQSFLQ